MSVDETVRAFNALPEWQRRLRLVFWRFQRDGMGPDTLVSYLSYRHADAMAAVNTAARWDEQTLVFAIETYLAAIPARGAVPAGFDEQLQDIAERARTALASYAAGRFPAFNVAVETGRLSFNEPNLQNYPYKVIKQR